MRFTTLLEIQFLNSIYGNGHRNDETIDLPNQKSVHCKAARAKLRMMAICYIQEGGGTSSRLRTGMKRLAVQNLRCSGTHGLRNFSFTSQKLHCEELDRVQLNVSPKEVPV